MLKPTQYELESIIYWCNEMGLQIDLAGADLRYANLAGANLTGADFYKADFRKASLNGANLTGADLRECSLQEADLRGANLSGVDLDYSAWPLSCSTLGVKADAKLVGQLLYHALDLAKNSGVTINDLSDVINLANDSKVVTVHERPKF